MTDLPRNMKITQVAERLNVSQTHVRTLIRKKELRCAHLGDRRALRIPREDVLAYEERMGIGERVTA